jgi:hypothetical protein
VPIAPDPLPDDPAALKRIIAAMAQDALTAQAEIARLKFQLARYREPSAHGLDRGGPSSAALRRSWRATPSSSSWRSRPWKPTKRSGSRQHRRRSLR